MPLFTTKPSQEKWPKSSVKMNEQENKYMEMFNYCSDKLAAGQ